MEKTVFKNFFSDVLVIGAGGAGLRAAIEAHDHGAKVLLVGKSLEGKAHTVMAEGGINAPLGSLDQRDNWLHYAADTLIEGQFIGSQEMAEKLAKESTNTTQPCERPCS